MASTVMHPKAAAGPGRSERRNVDTLNSPRATARKLLLSPRSLRAQDRSRGAPTRDSASPRLSHHRQTRNTTGTQKPQPISKA